MKNRIATSAFFGIDFQTNAAIVLMLENIKDLKTIRMEGYEDIEIGLDDDSFVLAQAKSVVQGSTDFSHVTQNLQNAIESLSDAVQKSPSVNKLIYITNSADPLGVPSERHIFMGIPSHRYYNELPPDSKKKVNNVLSSLGIQIDISKLLIQTLPFETDLIEERCKWVINAIRDFLNPIGVNINPSELHRIWENDIFKSGTKRNQELKLTKNDIVWPTIVLATRNLNFDDEDIEDSEAEEITRLYNDVINTLTEKYEFVTKVLFSFNEYKGGNSKNERKKLFIKSKYQEFLYLLEGIDMNDEVKESLIKIILHSILNKRVQIDNIKKASNL